MSPRNELDTFREVWNAESAHTVELLESLPEGQYGFRPDPDGRSLGELAWHLCEVEACLTFGIAEGRFSFADRAPNLERPLEIDLLAPGYRLIHKEAVARLDNLENDRLGESVAYFDGSAITIREVLWTQLLHHMIHHRGQLVLMCRQAGGTPPGVYGPNRERMQAIQAQMKGE